MRTQSKVVYLLLLLHFAASSEISFFKSSNYAHAHQHKNNILHYGRKPSPTTPPIQFLETPNFEIMLLNEENSDPTWRKYSQLFQPKDLRNAPVIEKLHKQTDDQRIGSVYNLDPVVDRILNMLDNDEQQMLNDLRKTYENPIFINGNPTRRRNFRPVVGYHQPASNIKVAKKEEPKLQLRDLLYKVPCNEGYVFLVENQKNPMNPNSLNDLLLRVTKVVTEMS